jgi:hypothetical protein
MQTVEEIQAEIDRVREQLSADADCLHAPELRAVNQALSWVLEPLVAAAPLPTIAGNPEGSEDYSERNRLPLS